MTKVQRKFRLEGALDERIMSRIADAHSIYGVLRVQLESSLDQLLVEYDASRLKLDEVEASLRRAGIPVAPAGPAGNPAA
jgi:hypothetical protein